MTSVRVPSCPRWLTANQTSWATKWCRISLLVAFSLQVGQYLPPLLFRWDETQDNPKKWPHLSEDIRWVPVFDQGWKQILHVIKSPSLIRMILSREFSDALKPKRKAVPESKSETLGKSGKKSVRILANLPAIRIIPIPKAISFFGSWFWIHGKTSVEDQFSIINWFSMIFLTSY